MKMFAKNNGSQMGPCAKAVQMLKFEIDAFQMHHLSWQHNIRKFKPHFLMLCCASLPTLQPFHESWIHTKNGNAALNVFAKKQKKRKQAHCQHCMEHF